jgi:hypothetical protein
MIEFSQFITERAKFDTTLMYHDKLNPLIWKNDKLRRDILNALLRIAHDWATFSRIPFEAIKDIIITGGNCNYNYTSFSDIDLHLVVDMKNIIKDPDILDDWLYDKKVLWAKYHPNIRIKGYPVELYAQDEKQDVKKGQGVYSLVKDDWISIPQHQNAQDIYNDKNLIRKIKYYAKQIDSFANEHTFPTKETINQAKKLKNKFHAMRSSGIQKAGEFAHENLIYKALRNMNYLDKLSQFINNAQDRDYSIN